MRHALKISLLCAVLMAGAAKAEAVPLLQLDIIGGRYDSATQTIISNGPTFTLVALLTTKPGQNSVSALLDTYFLSVALTPKTGPAHTPVGSFTMDKRWDSEGATRVEATRDMTYGTPPLEEATGGTHDGGDMGGHEVYPTFFSEFAFGFSPLQRTAVYNTQDRPGGLTPTSADSGSYYRLFDFSVALPGAYGLHFDLYDTFLRTQCTGKNKKRTCNTDEDIDHFAPFSHDAATGEAEIPPIPEPASLLLLASGLAFSANRIRKRSKTQA